MRRLTMVFAGLAAFGVGLTAGQGQTAPAQTAPAAQLPTSTSAEVNAFYNNITNFITRSLAMVPADKLTWQPTTEVRSYARMFAHIIDDNNSACAAMAGVTPNPPRVDAAAVAGSWPADKLSKADLEKGLADSIALCQKAFASVNQTNMMESAGGRGTRTKIGMLMYNTSHINEHYGNLVTYLRLNGMVPPSSAPRGGGAPVR